MATSSIENEKCPECGKDELDWTYDGKTGNEWGICNACGYEYVDEEIEEGK